MKISELQAALQPYKAIVTSSFAKKLKGIAEQKSHEGDRELSTTEMVDLTRLMLSYDQQHPKLGKKSSALFHRVNAMRDKRYDIFALFLLKTNDKLWNGSIFTKIVAIQDIKELTSACKKIPTPFLSAQMIDKLIHYTGLLYLLTDDLPASTSPIGISTAITQFFEKNSENLYKLPVVYRNEHCRSVLQGLTRNTGLAIAHNRLNKRDLVIDALAQLPSEYQTSVIFELCVRAAQHNQLNMTKITAFFTLPETWKSPDLFAYYLAAYHSEDLIRCKDLVATHLQTEDNFLLLLDCRKRLNSYAELEKTLVNWNALPVNLKTPENFKFVFSKRIITAEKSENSVFNLSNLFDKLPNQAKTEAWLKTIFSIPEVNNELASLLSKNITKTLLLDQTQISAFQEILTGDRAIHDKVTAINEFDYTRQPTVIIDQPIAHPPETPAINSNTAIREEIKTADPIRTPLPKVTPRPLASPASRLLARYGASVLIDTTLNSVMSAIANELNKPLDEKLTGLNQRQYDLGKRTRQSLSYLADPYTDPTSGVNTKQLLAMLWLAIHDKSVIDDSLFAEAYKRFMYMLYDLRRDDAISLEYPESDYEAYRNVSNAESFNKMIKSLAGLHPDIELVQIDITLAHQKLKAVTKELVILYVEQSMLEAKTEPAIKTLREMLQHIQRDRLFPPELWISIQTLLSERIYEEFGSLFDGPEDIKYLDFIYVAEHMELTNLPLQRWFDTLAHLAPSPASPSTPTVQQPGRAGVFGTSEEKHKIKTDMATSSVSLNTYKTELESLVELMKNVDKSILGELQHLSKFIDNPKCTPDRFNRDLSRCIGMLKGKVKLETAHQEAFQHCLDALEAIRTSIHNPGQTSTASIPPP